MYSCATQELCDSSCDCVTLCVLLESHALTLIIRFYVLLLPMTVPVTLLMCDTVSV